MELGGKANPEPARARALVAAYTEWTAVRNGERSTNGDRRESVLTMRPWNEAFYALAARTFFSQTDLEPVERAFRLPDSAFFELVPALLHALDTAYFESLRADMTHVARARRQVIERLVGTARRCREADPSGGSAVEISAGETIAAVCFCDGGSFGPPKSYLMTVGIDRAGSLFESVVPAMSTGHVPSLAACMLTTLEVSPRAAHAGVLAECASAWLDETSGTADLWTRTGLGRRIVMWFKDRATEEPSLVRDEVLRGQVLDVLARLVSRGVDNATATETLWRVAPKRTTTSGAS